MARAVDRVSKHTRVAAHLVVVDGAVGGGVLHQHAAHVAAHVKLVLVMHLHLHRDELARSRGAVRRLEAMQVTTAAALTAQT